MQFSMQKHVSNFFLPQGISGFWSIFWLNRVPRCMNQIKINKHFWHGNYWLTDEKGKNMRLFEQLK